MALSLSSAETMASERDSEKIKFEEAPSLYRSAVWDHFGFSVDYDENGKRTVNKQTTVCKHCFASIGYVAGNTTNMFSHLRRHHPSLSLGAARSRSVSASTANRAQPTTAAAFQQLYATNSEKHKTITKAVGVFIAKDMQPYSVVEDTGFRHMMKTVEPRYQVPSRIHFSSKVIPELYEVCRGDIENELRQAPYLALSTDSWTSHATVSYLTVTVHYILDWEMRGFVLQTHPLYESHTSEHLAEELVHAVTEWKLERANIPIPVTTDNAQNIVNAIRNTDVFGPHIGCFAHSLNLAAKKVVSLNSVSRLLGKVRKVVTFFHKSTTAHKVLADKQLMLNIPQHRLIHDVTTHWNTVHDMLERYVEQQPAIYSAILDKAVKKSVRDISMLTDSELKLAEELIQLLNPLKKMTTLMNSESTPTSSMILPLKTMTLKSMAPDPQDSPTIREAKLAVTRDLEKRYTDPDLLDCLHRATVLDPRFKSLPILDEAICDQVYKHLTSEIMEHQFQAVQEGPSNEQDQASSVSPPQELFGDLLKTEQQTKAFPQKIKEEVSSYKAAGGLNVDADPFRWWKEHQVTLPYISKVAQRYLCVPGTSVASKRVFSTAGDIVSASRSQLHPEHVDMLIFLQKNLNIIDL
ncbi:E3 SUMO-protein ligase ZBED1-like [Epinephelus lanceolatus]